MKTKVLYASYVKGNNIPYYVRYALKALSALNISVVYLTNQRDLDEESIDFLNAKKIELFLSENKGFDFGMWSRYLKSISLEEKKSWDRLCLINDSVIYYKNQFGSFFSKAENLSADMISLTCSEELSFHLQSFFLYLKPSAMTVLYAHLEEAAESDSFYEVVRNMEIGLSSRMLKCGLKLESLFKTSRNVLFSYDELIKEKAGFIKRKLLERRFTPKEKFHFLRHGGFSALYANYYEMIKKSGDADSSFPIDSIVVHKKNLQNQMKDFFLCLFFYALINPTEKIKKILKKNKLRKS